jgi:hypothetical protein
MATVVIRALRGVYRLNKSLVNTAPPRQARYSALKHPERRVQNGGCTRIKSLAPDWHQWVRSGSTRLRRSEIVEFSKLSGAGART